MRAPLVIRRPRVVLAGASLRTRVMAAAALLVVLTSVLTGVLGTTLLRSYLLGKSDAQLRDFAKVADHIQEWPKPRRPPGGRRRTLPTQFLVEVISATGKVTVAGSQLRTVGRPRLTTAQLGTPNVPFTVAGSSGPTHTWRVMVAPLPGGQHLVIGYSLDDLDSTVTRLEVADALAGLVAVALLAGIGLPLVRASLAPLRRIEATAAAIAAGDLSRRIDHPPVSTEVGRLAGALDTMLGTIEAAYRARADGEARALRSQDRMRRFVADASHELRTPLTSVRGVAEYGLQQGEAAGRDELLRLMALIQGEAGRMTRLVEDLLLLARFDTGRPLDLRPIDLASIAAEAVQRARIVDPGRPVMLRAAEPVVVCADAERIRQVIDNLIGNAMQHTPAGSPVTVTVASVPGTGRLTVTDLGPGMTTQQAAKVFERFYRTDSARSRARGGAGLGLAIAAALTAAHGGDITVDTALGRGASFHLRLPLATADGPPDDRADGPPNHRADGPPNHRADLAPDGVPGAAREGSGDGRPVPGYTSAQASSQPGSRAETS